MRAVIYLRVSRPDQKPENQLPALQRIAEARGLELVGEPIIERESGSKVKRKGLDALLQGCHRGDYQVVLVWAIDRLGRNMQAVVDTILRLDSLNVKVISHQEPWLAVDGLVRPLLLSIFAWVAQMEKARLVERSLAGLETARRKGTRLGRPTVVVDIDEALRLRKAGKSLRQAARQMGCGTATLQRALRRAG